MLALALIAGAAPLLLAPAGASAMAKGLMDENLPRSDDPAQRAAFFTVAKQAHVSFVRTYIQWDGTVDFPFPNEIASIRRMAIEASENGITTMFVGFNGQLGKRYHDARQIDLKRYQSVVAKSVEALRGLPIKLVWSPINEGNFFTLMPRVHGPEVWRKMQNIAYDQIKKLTPSAMVVAGELAPYARNKRKSTDPGLWFRQALGLDAHWKPLKGTKTSAYRIKADAITLHSYDYKVNPASKLKSDDMWTIRNIPRTRALLRLAAKAKRLPAVATKRVYITEFAYLAKGSQSVPEATAATYTARAWAIAKRDGIRGFLWFQVRDPAAVFFSGLETIDGQPRPVLPVFTNLQ